MKDNIKNTIFGISIVYSIVIIVLILINFLNSSVTIDLEDTYDNLKRLAELKTEVSNLKDSECKTAIKDFIEYYEKTSYDNNVNIKDMFHLANQESPISHYVKFSSSCDLKTHESNHSIADKTVEMALQQERIFIKNYFMYEIQIKDIFNRLFIEPSFYTQEYVISKRNQLEIIETLIELAKEVE